MRPKYLNEKETLRLATSIASLAELEDNNKVILALKWANKQDYVTYFHILEKVSGKPQAQIIPSLSPNTVLVETEEYLKKHRSYKPEFKDKIKFMDITLPENPTAKWFKETADKLFPPDYGKLWRWLREKWDFSTLQKTWQEWHCEKFEQGGMK
ncbi:MAG: hypothetical protein ACOZAL_00085 [Patescibacteria group bacterium]